jgi:hypothetical protein
MKAKKLQVTYLLPCLIFFASVAQAQDSLTVMLGKKVVCNMLCAKGEEPATCSIAAKAAKATYNNVTVYVRMQQRSAVYKNSIQVFYTTPDGNEKSVEAALEKGTAVFAAAAIKKMLVANKTITIRLVQNPANPRMSIPTRIRNLVIIKTQ